MKVHVVTEETGQYEDAYNDVRAVFATREAAEKYVANMAALPGIDKEYSSGREVTYEIEELEVWDDAPERVMRWCIWDYVPAPDWIKSKQARRPYRVETYYPEGYRQDLFSKIERRALEVRAASEEECLAEHQRLYAELLARGVE